MPSTADFFSALFSGYPPDASLRLELRCTPPQWDTEQYRRPRRFYPLEPFQYENVMHAARGWSESYEVYFGVLPRREKTEEERRAGKKMGGKDSVFYTNWIWCDVDGGEEGCEGCISLIKQSDLPKPDIAVCSGGGVHCYWRLAETWELPNEEARQQFRTLLRRVTLAVGGVSPASHADTSSCDAARVLRVPGTRNWKIEEQPRPVRLLRFNCSLLLYREQLNRSLNNTGERGSAGSDTVTEQPRFNSSPYNNTEQLNNEGVPHSYEWWGTHLPVEPVTKIEFFAKEHKAYTDAGFISEGLLWWAQSGRAEGKRHLDLLGDACWLVRKCKLSKADALYLLKIRAANSPGQRRITEHELERMIEWA